MTSSATADVLAEIDSHRGASGLPADPVVREYVLDGSECRIMYSRLKTDTADDVIREEMALARHHGYVLEWKYYGHDRPTDLSQRLLSAGFRSDDLEQVLVLSVNETTIATFPTPSGCQVRRVEGAKGLADYAEIAREIGRGDCDKERQRLAAILREAPDTLNIYIAYVDEEPSAGGRLHLERGSKCAELAGGRTKTTHRGRGLFTAVVAARLRGGLAVGRQLALIDALPTSEAILIRRGFRRVTSTQPFVYNPAS